MFSIAIDVGAPIQIGDEPGCMRRCIPLLGGTVSGRHLGVVLPGGADWQNVLSDGTVEIDARYVLELGEGLVEVRSQGLRSGSPEVLARLAAGEHVPPTAYYFRTAMWFFTAAPKLAYLNGLLATAGGQRLANRVHLEVRKVP